MGCLGNLLWFLFGGALSGLSWGRYVGLDGAMVTMDGFGASGPAATLFEQFGFTVENVVRVARELL